MITGSFDPLTVGHVNVVERATKIFDKVFVVILQNPEKIMTFDIEKRMKMLSNALSKFENVEIASFNGLAIDFAEKNSCNCIVRGIRNSADLSYEMSMRDWNFEHGNIETVFISTEQNFANVSSTLAKHNARHGNYDMIPQENIEIVKFNLEK